MFLGRFAHDPPAGRAILDEVDLWVSFRVEGQSLPGTL
jgi:hypothetical protein